MNKTSYFKTRDGAVIVCSTILVNGKFVNTVEIHFAGGAKMSIDNNCECQISVTNPGDYSITDKDGTPLTMQEVEAGKE